MFKLINIKDTDNMKYEKYTNLMNPYGIEDLRSDAGFGVNPGRLGSKSMLGADMDKNVS